MSILTDLLYELPALLLALSAHEFAHGYASYLLGDPTPKYEGRLSLNPMRHLDLIGTLSLLIFHFGWAKPVSIDARYYDNKKSGMLTVAMAGPFMNFLLAFISIFFSCLLQIFLYKGAIGYTFLIKTLDLFLSYSIIYNLGLGTFNLLPVPPLDGSKILGAILPERTYFSLMRYERYGMLILMTLLYVGVLDTPLAFFRNAVYDSMINVSMVLLNLIL